MLARNLGRRDGMAWQKKPPRQKSKHAGDGSDPQNTRLGGRKQKKHPGGGGPGGKALKGRRTKNLSNTFKKSHNQEGTRGGCSLGGHKKMVDTKDKGVVDVMSSEADGEETRSPEEAGGEKS